jgi:hypothetical protein
MPKQTLKWVQRSLSNHQTIIIDRNVDAFIVQVTVELTTAKNSLNQSWQQNS